MQTTVGNWHILQELGKGGQGTVYKSRKGADPREEPLRLVLGAASTIAQFASRGSDDLIAAQRKGLTILNDPQKLLDLADSYVLASEKIDLGALKILHPVDDDESRAKAKQRLAKEVEAFHRVSHPSLLRIVDSNVDDGWLVTEYQGLGTIMMAREPFKGDLERTLRAFRPLVDGVSALHTAGLVHRDIKPENIFNSAHAGLLLGDMGIVYFEDDGHTRVSETYENVGSRDWMPPWAQSQRLDTVLPAFDVFSLGKVFWSMLSGRSRLPFWYHRRDSNDLEKMFPTASEMRFARWVLDESVVEDEEACLPNAAKLLERVDECLLAVSRRGQSAGTLRYCRVCALGHYVQKIAETDGSQQQNFGIRPSGMSGFRVFVCDWCGHCELFHFDNYNNPADWWSGRPPKSDGKK